MIFELKKQENKKTEKVFKSALKDLENFFEYKWATTPPRLFIINSLKLKREMYGKDVPKWLKGYSTGTSIFISTKKLIQEEDAPKFNDEKYAALIKHELCHCFYRRTTKSEAPTWLNEGLSTYLSGQLKWKKGVGEYKYFLEKQTGYTSSGIYGESGFVVEVLIKKYGKKKLLELLSEIGKERPNEKKFKQLFKKIYGLNLNYNEINKRITSINLP